MKTPKRRYLARGFGTLNGIIHSLKHFTPAIMDTDEQFYYEVWTEKNGERVAVLGKQHNTASQAETDGDALVARYECTCGKKFFTTQVFDHHIEHCAKNGT